MTRAVIGIDPGKKGAVVLVTDAHASGFVLPTSTAGLDGRQLVVELMELRNPLGYRAGGDILVIVERAQSFPGQGIASAFKYGRDYGRILGILDALGWPYETVPPAQWHRQIVGGDPAEGKARAAAVVAARLPDLELRPGRCRVPHDGIVDAACLALWGRGRG
jgi:crossover junction endodeoxyribonuclease RuvC